MKVIVPNYTFDASAQTVTFTDYASITLERVLAVINVTDQVVIYQPNNSAKGATAATNVLTLEHDTTAMDDTDDLMVIYDDITQDYWKKEDAAAASGDAGVPVLARRADAPASSAGTDGDYANVNTDDLGRLRVVVGKIKTVSTTSSGLSDGTYAAGDMLGTQWTFADVAAIAGGAWEIVSATMFCENLALGPCDLFLFNASVTQAADNAANSWSDADMALCVGVISFPPPANSALNQISTVPNLSLFGECAADDNLYGGLVTRVGLTTPNFSTNTDTITIRLVVRRA